MILTRQHHLLRLAYIEGDAEAAKGLLDSWYAYRPKLQNPFDHFPSAEAFLHNQQVPYAIPYDLVFVALALPGLPGDELIRLAKAQPETQAQTFYIVTANNKVTAQQLQKVVEAEGWAEKPLRAAGILSELGKLERRYGLEIVDLDPPARWTPPPTPAPAF